MVNFERDSTKVENYHIDNYQIVFEWYLILNKTSKPQDRGLKDFPYKSSLRSPRVILRVVFIAIT